MKKPSGKRPVNKSTASSKLRIIGGEWRSRQLPIPNIEGLRPTTDRVRETVFNWLNFDIPGASCLDLFCGTGALGFEALSRGAKDCTFVELNRSVSEQIKTNLKTLHAQNAKVNNTDAAGFLRQPATPFDVVFLDPPFRKDLLDQVIPLLADGWITPQGYIYIERESEKRLNLPTNWHLEKEKVAGQLTFSLYRNA